MKNKTDKKIELLSPAGELATLKAAVNAGADAVYCAGAMFGARAYAKNFTAEELVRGIEYCHRHGAKLYLTVNTLLKNLELEELCDYIAPFYEAGLDAVLVQDIGVFSVLKKNFSRLALHASTQMSIANASGAAFLKNLGFSRIVTARELSLNELKNIIQNVDIEIETFVHGALCYSYSGMCLMSSMIGARSGNRGRCAGTCRLPFDGKYPLSLKDLCTIRFLDKIIDAGVASLKIEGRMKSPEYSAGVTSIYRRKIDEYYETGADGYSVSDYEMQQLTDLGNRSGYTDGFYFRHNDENMVTIDSPSHTHAPEGVLKDRYDHFLQDEKVEIRGRFTMKKDAPMSLTVDFRGETVTVFSDPPTTAKNRPVTEQAVVEKLMKTGDSDFCFGDIDCEIDDGLFVPMQWVKELRRDALRALKERLPEKEKRTGP